MTEQERWKVHPVHMGYAVSDAGNVKRVTSGKGVKPGRILKAGRTPYGYRRVSLSADGKVTYRMVHQLVLETFIGPRPRGLEAIHRNDVKGDDRLDNLGWGTHSENYADRVRFGGGNHGSRHGMAKLDEARVVKIRDLCRRGMAQTEAAEIFGVSDACIYMIVTRKHWRHI